MKQLFCALLLLATFTSCSHDEPAPNPNLTGGKWTLKTQTSLATPKDGTPATTSAYPVTDEVTMTFLNDTRFNLDVKSTTTSGRHFEGAYTYQGQVLTLPRLYIWNMPYYTVASRTLQVTELSAHKLVTEDHWENIAIGDGYYEPTKYVTTDTYTR
jgi:hypothetical protein